MLLSKSNSKTFGSNNVMLLPKNYKPCASDILCGRGRSYAKHEGNKRFSDIVKRNIPRYIQGRNRTDRRVIVGSIVEYIEEQGFRFIKVDTETQQYYQLDSDAVHEKTGHAIRDLIKLNGFKEAKSRVSPVSSLNTKLEDTVPPSKAVSPDSQQGDFEPRKQSSLDCIVWPQNDCSLDERAVLANLAMSIELRQFPDTTMPALCHSSKMESCNLSMFDAGFLPNTDLLVPLNSKLNQHDSCDIKLYDDNLESTLQFPNFSSLGPMATNALNNFEIEFGSMLETLP